jgi:D-aminoacyl-tRNA deacylase
MRVIVQRVSRAEVRVDGREVGSIGKGLLVLAGFCAEDTAADFDWIAGKLARLRIFSDDSGQMNRSVVEVEGDVLLVSQFTLYAETKKGNRPGFSRAAPPLIAQASFQEFHRTLSAELGKPVPTGVFGADMAVDLVNDGPVTLMIDSQRRE